MIGLTCFPELEYSKAGFNAWVEGLPLGKSECALASFYLEYFYNRGFTTDKELLKRHIQGLKGSGKADHYPNIVIPMEKALQAVENRKYKKVVVLVPNGYYPDNSSAIIQKANSIDATVYGVTYGSGCPPFLRNIATQTGGKCYSNITSKEMAEEVFRRILQEAQEIEPCEIEWKSEFPCHEGDNNVEIKLLQNNSKTITSYRVPNLSLANLEFNPPTVKFLNPTIGVIVEDKVIVKARNIDFNITNIKSSNPAFTISPLSFVLKEGESKELTVSYMPTDSNYNFCKFEIESEPCKTYHHAVGSYIGKKPTFQTLKLTHPNGGETFVVGSNTLITWEGIPPDDKVLLEYSTDNGQNWQTLTNEASGLSYKWTNIPRPVSSKCLVRVSQGSGLLNSDPNDPAPQIVWQNTFGGSEMESAKSIQETSDGGFILAGETGSIDGDVPEDKGEWDAWIIKLRFDGSIEWQKIYGGSKSEGFSSIQETSTGGFIVAGSTHSNDGDITENRGTIDLWVMKIDADGKIEWQKTYGGSYWDVANSIQETSDGGYIVAGYTRSKNGDITENKGDYDVWVLKLDIDGNIEWQKTYGGSGNDIANFIRETSDGGFIVAARTSSNDGDVLENKGIVNFWMIKLNIDGSIEWQRTYGGSKIDVAYSIQETHDGGYIVAGWASSYDGDVKEKKGNTTNVWILKLALDGSLEWQKTFEGQNGSGVHSIHVASDGGYIFAGYLSTLDGNYKRDKVLVFKLGVDGNLEWQKTYGGSNTDRAYSIQETRDGGYIVTGYTESNDGDVTENKGEADIWVIKLEGSGTVLQSDVSDAVFSIVEPIAASRDIDMEQVLVGFVKDSVINEFVSNTGSWKFRVDSIYIQGADASAFSLVGGLPQYTIEPNDSYFGEFRFIPKRVGIHRAEVVIVTQAETIIQNIIGEGVEPRLEVITDFLDFGQVEIGNERTISDTVLIKNISSSPITIDDVVQLGPDMTQFKIISGGGSFTLMPNEERAMTLMFKPIFGGRTSGQLGFVYDGTGSPAVAQLFGAGIGGLVYISNDSAYAGEKRTLSLMMSKVKPEGIASIAPNFEATIRFQRTILYPENPSSINFVNDSIYITINGTIGTSLEIAEIPVIAGLGIVEETLVDIVDMKLKDKNGNYVEYDFEKQSGTFKLLGICYEGGTRLFNPNSQAGILSIAPNPADDNLEIVVSLIESGNTDLSIYNTMGEKIMTVLSTQSPESGIQIFDIDTKLLSTGQYYLQLRTPTHIENQIIKIVK
jgi:hypothetical protein